MERGIIFGFGSEIGCKLVELSLMSKEIIVDTIVNNSHGSLEDDLKSLKAKLIFSNPKLINNVEIDTNNSLLLIGGVKINCIFKNIENFLIDNKNLDRKFDFWYFSY